MPTTWQTNVSPAADIGGPQGSLDPTDPESRYKLVVDIQQQLKRVGCYWGRVNGSWNNNTRESMRSFTTHTNAALPVEKPDYLLLSLLKSHAGRSCGAPETTVAVQPRGKNEHVAAATPEVLPWKAGNAAQPATRLYTPLPNSVVSTEPLPGRMAIGGPKEFPPAVQAPLIPGTAPGTAAPGQPGVATAALDPGVAPPASVSTHVRWAEAAASSQEVWVMASSRAGNATLQSDAQSRRRLLSATASSPQSLSAAAVSSPSQRR